MLLRRLLEPRNERLCRKRMLRVPRVRRLLRPLRECRRHAHFLLLVCINLPLQLHLLLPDLTLELRRKRARQAKRAGDGRWGAQGGWAAAVGAAVGAGGDKRAEVSVQNNYRSYQCGVMPHVHLLRGALDHGEVCAFVHGSCGHCSHSEAFREGWCCSGVQRTKRA